MGNFFYLSPFEGVKCSILVDEYFFHWKYSPLLQGRKKWNAAINENTFFFLLTQTGFIMLLAEVDKIIYLCFSVQLLLDSEASV